MNKKNVVVYGIKYFPSRGGTSRVAESIIKNICTDFNIRIYCYKDPKAKNHIEGVKAIQFPKFPFGGFGVFFYFLFTAIHLLLFVNKKSIIHAHKTDCAFFLPILRLKFKKIVATSHEAPYHRDKWNKFGKAYFHLVEKIFMNSGVTLTSISQPLTDYYIKKYKKNVTFIPNGIDINQNIDTDSAQKILAQYKINGKFITYSARRIMSTKGLHTMLEALHLQNSDLPVIIAGDGNHSEKYVSRLKIKYKHLNLIFTGYLDLPVLLGLIRLSGVFIFPSEIEGMSIMLLEVVAVGTHLICSDIPENTQIFDNSEVLYFRNKDPEDLKNKIEFAQNNPDKMDEFTKKSIKKIKEKLNWNSISSEYARIYTS